MTDGERDALRALVLDTVGAVAGAFERRLGERLDVLQTTLRDVQVDVVFALDKLDALEVVVGDVRAHFGARPFVTSSGRTEPSEPRAVEPRVVVGVLGEVVERDFPGELAPGGVFALDLHATSELARVDVARAEAVAPPSWEPIAALARGLRGDMSPERETEGGEGGGAQQEG